MDSKKKTITKWRMFLIVGIFILLILGTALLAWSWDRSGNNYSFAAGRVFIGVSSPTSSHSGDANAYLQVHNPENNSNNYEVARFTAKPGSNRFAYITIGDAVLESKGTQGYIGYSPGERKWVIGTHFNGPTMTLKSAGEGGYVGIGNTNPLYPLHLASGAYVSPGGTWTNASSREYKNNIQGLKIEDAMKALHGLHPVTFSYKVFPEENHVGFIAEDVPNLVATKDRKGLSSMDVVAVLTKVVQEQQKTIQDLQEKNSRLMQLEQRLLVLEGK